ncbi:MAG TPA: ABC transporter permease [Verrucomicrobiae bacterium]|nr:ABC transporter permease [Verrucomicrobiae bacterium]
MRLIAIIKIAIRALMKNVLRTSLTMLGIIIGVGAVITMVSIGNGAKAQIESNIAALGQNTIGIWSGNFRRGGVSMGFGSAGTLTKEDMAAIQREVPGVLAISPEVRSGAQIAAGNQNISTSVMGVSASYPEFRNWTFASGGPFTEQDVSSQAKVALIGKTTATTLFGETDPVGQTIRVRNAPFTIVGLLNAKGGGFGGQDQDDVVMIPWTSALTRLTGGTTFRNLSLQGASADALEEISEGITSLLRQRHRIQEGMDDDFSIRTQTETLETFTSTAKTMTVLLGSIAGVSLLVGGIGIMNIMLVSVTERTREIGIRMAVGAKSGDILSQFLAEAVTLSIVGGIAGIGMGVGASRLVSSQMGWPVLTSSNAITVAFLFSAAIGIFFGFYPARKAAQLDPIESLRYE